MLNKYLKKYQVNDRKPHSVKRIDLGSSPIVQTLFVSTKQVENLSFYIETNLTQDFFGTMFSTFYYGKFNCIQK